MPETSPSAVEAAMAIAAQADPDPARALEALRVLCNEVWYRWEQRTALSFRLQDLRAQLAGAGIDDQSLLYQALHDVTATAEAWMHPGTLVEAAKTHVRRLQAEIASLKASPVQAEAIARAVENIAGMRVFVTSRERIKHPEGTDLFDESIGTLRAHAASLRHIGEKQ